MAHTAKKQDIFVTFPETAIGRCSRKYLFLKYGREIFVGREAAFLSKLLALKSIQSFPCIF